MRETWSAHSTRAAMPCRAGFPRDAGKADVAAATTVAGEHSTGIRGVRVQGELCAGQIQAAACGIPTAATCAADTPISAVATLTTIAAMSASATIAASGQKLELRRLTGRAAGAASAPLSSLPAIATGAAKPSFAAR